LWRRLLTYRTDFPSVTSLAMENLQIVAERAMDRVQVFHWSAARGTAKSAII